MSDRLSAELAHQYGRAERVVPQHDHWRKATVAAYNAGPPATADVYLGMQPADPLAAVTPGVPVARHVGALAAGTVVWVATMTEGQLLVMAAM